MDRDRAGVGKKVGGELYVHRSAVDNLVSEHVSRIATASDLVPDFDWNVAKIDLAGGRAVSLLDYEDFAKSAFPALRESRRVNLETGAAIVRRYKKNPPILHRKELLLPLDFPGRETYLALTQELERLGLFVEMTRRGRQDAWQAALAAARITIHEHRVILSEAP